nr:hypothetical protein BaRGS_013111 [Batillaria attramentaria]
MMWQLVLFSDESRFLVKPRVGRIRVWRRLGEQLADDAVREVTAFGGGSVMIYLADGPVPRGTGHPSGGRRCLTPERKRQMSLPSTNEVPPTIRLERRDHEP